jgi:hypothetical protein
MAVGLDQQGLVATLEQVPHPTLRAIDVTRVAKRQVLHAARQWCVAGLQGQMHVVGHQTKRVHPVTEPSTPLFEQGVQHLAVLRVEKDLLLRVATQDDVVQTTGQVNAGLSGHG